ncbi:MAG: stage 0 sporulation family protein [Clostridia bacterium]|nr:stage 0 sporulation family protein [Clostridia bacterium]
MENTNVNVENTEVAEVKESYEIIGIRFKEVGKIYYFDPNSLTFTVGDKAIVETSRGVEYGHVLVANKTVPASEVVLPLKKVLRKATEDDTRRLVENEAVAERAKAIFKEKCVQHKLEMDLVDAEMTFDNSKLLFYFTSEGRVDFREFVKDLAAVFKTRIELRQIGVRDEAKQLGGLGICGREFCCHSFLSDFDQVSIKMAKEQGLSLNSAKISGTCGRLMCCLRYENDTYEEEIRKTPRVGSIVSTPSGKGMVVDANPLAGIIKVSLDSNKDASPVQFIREQVKVLSAKKPSPQEENELDEEIE